MSHIHKKVYDWEQIDLGGVSDCGVLPTLQFFSYIMQEQVAFQWDDVCFVLDLHSLSDFYCASSLKQQSASRYVAAVGHIIFISSQPVFAP